MVDWPDKFFYVKLFIVAALVYLACTLWVSFTDAYVPFPLYVLMWTLTWILTPTIHEVDA